MLSAERGLLKRRSQKYLTIRITFRAKITMNAEGVFIVPLGILRPENMLHNMFKGFFEGDLPSYDYLNGCALFLLIQEHYPKQYDFPNTKVNDYDSGEAETISLILKSVGNVVTW